MPGTFNVCPKQQCRGRTDHSTLRHWTPVYIGEAACVIGAHWKGKCWCRKSLAADLWRLTWETVSYFAREAKRWVGYRVLHRDW